MPMPGQLHSFLVRSSIAAVQEAGRSEGGVWAGLLLLGWDDR